jgi:SPP1 gp7 family putative phage head morphogenesis protein
MRRYERDATERLHAALLAWGRGLLRGVPENAPEVILARLDDPERLKPFRDALVAVLQGIAIAGAEHGRKQVERGVFGVKRQGGDVLDILWDLANADAAQWAITYGSQLVTGIQDATRRRIAAEVRDYVNNSMTIGQLRDRIIGASAQETAGPFSRARARTIAVTETTRAYAEGNMAAWRQSGVIQRKEWQTNADELVCPICGPLQGVIVPMNERFYGRLDGPPAHPNCRCWISPVPPDDDEVFGGHFAYEQLTPEQAVQP